MPDLKCPRCGRRVEPEDCVCIDAEDTEDSVIVYVCPCGPLCVVEGERVAWYAPIAEVRPPLARYVKALEERLTPRDESHGPRGWESDTLASLLGPLKRRYEHLTALVETGADTARIADEAAHLGNYAMMLFDLAYDDWMASLRLVMERANAAHPEARP